MSTIKLFGISLSPNEQAHFLSKIGVHETEVSFAFLNDFIAKFLNKIPFNNLKMLERGFGKIPTQQNIKEDMLMLTGGTCATMNTFAATILHNIGFDVTLITGTMLNLNDHIAILLKLNYKTYIVDVGDGQPYFNPISTENHQKTFHPFRTFKTIPSENKVKIDFLIQNHWKTDVLIDTIPKTFKNIHKTLEQHYTQENFGPFWNGVRFVLYPNKKILALKDDTFIIQKNNTIRKEKIKSKVHLIDIVNEYFPNFKKQIIAAYTNLEFYDK